MYVVLTLSYFAITQQRPAVCHDDELIQFPIYDAARLSLSTRPKMSDDAEKNVINNQK